jgi:hypothetical protein
LTSEKGFDFEELRKYKEAPSYCFRHGEPSTQSEIASAAGLSDDKSLRRVIKLLQLIDIKHPS